MLKNDLSKLCLLKGRMNFNQIKLVKILQEKAESEPKACPKHKTCIDILLGNAQEQIRL